MKVIGQLLQACCLSLVQRRVAFRVVANEDLAESRVKILNVSGEIGAELKVKFVVPAFLGRARGDETIRRGVPQNGGAKLFVHENARLFPGHSGRNGGFEAVVDHLFSCGDFSDLLGRQSTVPAKHFSNERAAMIKGQDVERLVKAGSSHGIFSSFR